MSDETVNETEETEATEEAAPVEEAAQGAVVPEPEVEEVPAAAEAVAEAPLEEAEPTEPAAEAPAAEAPAPEAPAAEAPAEEAPAEEAPAEEAPAEEAPAEETAAAAAAPAALVRKKKQKRLPRPLRRQRTKAKREKSAERKPITRLSKPEHARGRRQERQGMVVSASADKTIVVRVDVAKVHPIYKKVVKRSSRFHAHDEENQAKVGDVVRIVETRPISRLKRWRLQEIVEAAK
jgi:small subunit ribosomal protein S17